MEGYAGTNPQGSLFDSVGFWEVPAFGGACRLMRSLTIHVGVLSVIWALEIQDRNFVGVARLSISTSTDGKTFVMQEEVLLINS